jgi:signal transduction histidine kinase
VSRSRPDVLPRHVYWVLIGIQLLLTTTKIIPTAGASTFFLFLYTIVSLLVRWRLPLPVSTMMIDTVLIGGISLFYPENTIFLPIFVFYFCVHNRPIFTLPALIAICNHPTLFTCLILLGAIISGYLLYIWERQRTELQDEVNVLHQRIHGMTQNEEHLLRDQYNVERLSRLTERQRIAEILHDNLGHELTAAHVTLKASGALLDQGNNDNARLLLQKAQQRLGAALGQLRKAVQQIEPNDDFDLKRITILVHSFTFPVQFNSSGNFTDIPVAIHQLLYVSMQEALTNIMKHATPNAVVVHLERTPAIIRVILENDGLDRTQPMHVGNGLRYMRKRIEAINGSLSIQHDKTFRLIITLPLKE